MDIKSLEYFISIYEHKSINTAAKKTYISQQGLSKALRNMEAELEVPLFRRDKSGLIPTKFGIQLYKDAKKIYSDFQNIFRKQEGLKNERKGSLRIGVADSVLPSISLEKPLSLFQKDFPDITLELMYGSDERCQKALTDERLNLGLLPGPVNKELFQTFFLQRNTYCIWMHQDNPLAGKEMIYGSDVAQYPLISVSSKYNGSLLSPSRMTEDNLKDFITYVCDEPMTIQYMVSQNMGIAPCPSYWNQFLSGNSAVTSRPFVYDDGTVRSFDIFVCSLKALIATPNEKLFINYLCDYYS